MRRDAGGLPSTAMHHNPRGTPDESTQNLISDIQSCKVVDEMDDLEIHEHFKLRIQTYKSWASCISKKSCPEILIDGFKSDLSNDFTLMINWLAIIDEKSRSVLESTNNGNESMEFEAALDMLLRMGIRQKRFRGPTVDAFRELIAVLCGGVRGQVPRLEFLANFTEASRFFDEKASETIIKIVKVFFNLCNDAIPVPPLSAVVLKNSGSPKVMLDVESPLAHSRIEPDEEEVAGESYISCSPGRSNDGCDNGEGSSVLYANAEEISTGRTESSRFGSSPSKSPVVKSKRGIFSIKERKVGKIGKSSTSGDCFICGKSGDLIGCGKKYTSGIFCATKFHEKCIEDYNAAEYSVKCLRKILDEIVCPLHFCSTCYLERWKTTAVRGRLIECDSCFRSFHVECCPAGFEVYEGVMPVRTKEGNMIEIKQEFTRCHSHCNTSSIPLVENKRSHLPFCCECEIIGEEPLLRCTQCVRSFHDNCLTLNYRDLHNATTVNRPLCESCILGETLRIGQAVIAKFRVSFYAAIITKLEDYPKRCIKMDKYGKYYNQPGYISVKWAGCDNLYQLLPARCVVPMFTGSYELIGKRVKEEPCRAAWEEMERDLTMPRPIFDYIPEKYVKIKTSVYHPSCPKPRLDGCEESDSMCDCTATDSDRCGPNSKCTNRAILQECPEACEAIGGGCNNRGVSRREVNPDIEIREAPGKGMGAFAVRNIPKGSFIAEYAGEIISNKEMNRRIAEITAHRNVEEKHYMMALDAHRIIDCKEKGNDASPNCKVETVYVVVSKTKRPNGVYVKYDKRITIYTTEDVPAGSELCFNYQMRQFNIGCPLPDCKCGAPNCTGTLGSIAVTAPDKIDSEVLTADIAKQRRKKRLSRRLCTQEPPYKKPLVVRRGTIANTADPSSSNSNNNGKDQKSILNERPTVTFKRAPSLSKSQLYVRGSPSPLRRRGHTRRSKTVSEIKGVLDGSKVEASENIVVEKLLNRALLRGSALETFPNNVSSRKIQNNRPATATGRVNGSTSTRGVPVLIPTTEIMQAELS